MKIGELLDSVGTRDVPHVYVDSHIDEVIRVLTEFPHTRVVYVVDDQNRLVGTINIGSVLRHVFPHHYEGKIHPHGMLRRLTAETAQHIMDRSEVYATLDETVEHVLRRMARTGVKEMAVIDDDGRVLADVTAADLLQHYHLAKKDFEAEDEEGDEPSP